MVSARLLALLVATLVVAGACGAERPELDASGTVETDAIDAPTTEVIVVGDQVTEDDRSETGTAGQAATGRSARAIVADAAGDPDGDSDGDSDGDAGSDGDSTTPDPTRTPLVVLDTDMGPDIDDALALAMLHTYQDRGQAEIAAVTLSRNSELGARFIDAMNTWYGHPDIPVGIDRRAPFTMVESSSYVSLANRWSNDVASDPIPDGVTVLRQVLVRAIAENRPVVIVQVGFSGNTAALLDSRPDQMSVLGGTELVTRSGALLSVMAGSVKDRVEFNVANDVASARRVIEVWPGDIVLSPFEVGYDLHYPYTAIRDRLAGDGSNLIRAAYEFTDYSWHADAPPFYDMRTWDLTSVMQGVEPEAGWFPLSARGRITMNADGRTFFTPGAGRHQILVRNDMTTERMDRARNGMIDLVSASVP